MGYLKRSITLILFSSILLMILLFSFSPFIVSTGTLSQNVLELLMIVVPFSALETFLDSFLLGRYTVKRLAAGRVLFDIFRLVATVYFVVIGMGIFGVALGWLCSEIIAVSIFGAASVAGLEKSSSSLEMRPILAFALPSLIFQAIDVTIQNTDRIILLYLEDLVALAVYDVILSILFMMSFLSLAIATALYPVLTRYRLKAEEVGDSSQLLGPVVSRLSRYILVFLMPVSLIAALNSRIILNILFGAAYADYPFAALAFSMLVISYAIWGLTYALHSVLRSLSETRFFILSGTGVILFELIGCWYLTYMLGFIGCAIIRCLYIGILFLAAWARLRQHKIYWARLTIRPAVKISMAASIAALVTFILNPVSLPSLVFGVFASSFVYFFLLFLLREVSRQDFAIAKAILPTALHGVIDLVQRNYER
jgi:O-antigen/teichoic acid export membrane protein